MLLSQKCIVAIIRIDKPQSMRGGMQYDLDPILCPSIGLISLASFVIFALYVTRHGGYYKIRRWKTAIRFALLSTVLFVVIFIIIYGGADLFNRSPLWNPDFLLRVKLEDVLQLFTSILIQILNISACLVPWLFIITLGTYHQLKWWLNSDDYLDEIWKDQNRPPRSPIEWI